MVVVDCVVISSVVVVVVVVGSVTIVQLLLVTSRSLNTALTSLVSLPAKILMSL